MRPASCAGVMLLTYLLTYLPTYLPTYLLTYETASSEAGVMCLRHVPAPLHHTLNITSRSDSNPTPTYSYSTPTPHEP